MISAKKIDKIQMILNRLYPNPPAPLNYQCAFTFLCAVVLSAQTTDGKVNEVTKTLFKLAPTPSRLAAMNVDAVREIIQPVGLAPKKAEYLVGLAKKLVTDFDSKVPDTYEELESLPGVGHKTASVILSHVYEVNAIAVDTHVHRLALRWGLSKDEKNVNNVQKDLMKLFPASVWGLVHLQMIYFGREYCVAKGHENKDCPICSWIHKKDTDIDVSVCGMIPPTSHSKAKGIVYYEDRIAELRHHPLPTFDLHRRNGTSNTASIAEHKEAEEPTLTQIKEQVASTERVKPKRKLIASEAADSLGPILVTRAATRSQQQPTKPAVTNKKAKRV